VGQIPWGHNRVLLDRIKDPAEREWYVRATIEHGWSRAILDYQIDTGLVRRQGRGVTNFERTLPSPQSELAMQILKDPYNFDFLGLGNEAHEREVHRGLLQHLRAFLTELGAGVAFVGSEVHLEVEGDDFYIDLLFYHLKLRDMAKPMGIAAHRLTEELPDALKGQLPTIEELEAELEDVSLDDNGGEGG